MAQLHCNRQSVRYGLAKIHKALEDGILSFHLNLSAVGIIKDSFSFINEVLEFSVSLFMASFNIKSLLAKLPLTQTLNLCVQNLYRNQTHFGNLTKSSFCSLLELPCLHNFLYSMENFMSNAMAQQWVLVQDIHRIMSLCVILKTFGQKTVLLISNQLFIDDSLMIHLYFFEQRIMLKSWKIISINNIKP